MMLIDLCWWDRCNQCGRSSALPSRFYELELNIQGHKNLTECVTEFLKVTLLCLIMSPDCTLQTRLKSCRGLWILLYLMLGVIRLEKPWKWPELCCNFEYFTARWSASRFLLFYLKGNTSRLLCFCVCRGFLDSVGCDMRLTCPCCFSGVLQEEKLDGDNRYFCESCQSKQCATRRIKLHSLPRTLNLQLMRFVFDRRVDRASF